MVWLLLQFVMWLREMERDMETEAGWGSERGYVNIVAVDTEWHS